MFKNGSPKTIQDPVVAVIDFSEYVTLVHTDVTKSVQILWAENYKSSRKAVRGCT